jgi:DNA-directed RNA polymerase specialized sigma24 family protein
VARQLRNDEIDQLIYGYQEGATVYELADRFRIHRLTVSRHLHRAGVAMRRRGLDEQEVEAAVQLHREGWSVAQLGNRFGVDKRTARSALRARGCQV